MAFKILTENSVDNTNIDGARAEHFNAGLRDGIVKGAFNEGTFTALASNVISFDTCELRISGHRVIIDEIWTQTFSSSPSVATRYALVGQIVVDSSSNVDFSLFVQNSNTALVKNNLFRTENGAGTYQVEIGRFTLTTNGTIADIVRTLDVITGGSSGMGEHFISGNITTTMLESGMDANVTAEDVYDANGNYQQTDFEFELPETAGTVVKVNNIEQANLDFLSDPQTQLNGKADASNVYTKTETDTLLSAKADTSTLNDYVTKTTTQEVSGAKTFTGDNTYKTNGVTYGAKIPDTTGWTSNKTIAMTDLLPVGSLIAYAGSTAPTGWLWCNGSTFNQADYPELYSVLGTNALPDMNHCFPEGTSTASEIYSGTNTQPTAAGLPNIKGEFLAYTFGTGNPAGAFSSTTSSNNVLNSGNQGNYNYKKFYFNAHSSNNIYDDSITTVQPKSYRFMYIIKAK